MGKLLGYLLGELPLWLIGLLTNWLPDNPATCRLRGVLAKPFFGACGRNFQYGSRVRFLKPRGISLGDHVYIASGCWVSGTGGLEIGDEVMFGPYCVVTTASHGCKDGSYRFGGAVPAPVKIGSGSWLAAHVVVGAGTTIGDGCVIGANAVVTKDLPDHVLAGGIPAKVIRSDVHAKPDGPAGGSPDDGQ
jgi:acetyltransferase-like isoleucine patch superfamily enzyme